MIKKLSTRDKKCLAIIEQRVAAGAPGAKEVHDNLKKKLGISDTNDNLTCTRALEKYSEKPADTKSILTRALNSYVKALFTGGSISNEVRAALDITNTGDSFLPKQMQQQILLPQAKSSPLRSICTMSNIERLEIPVSTYSDEGNVTITNEVIEFNKSNNRERILTEINESLINSNLNIYDTISNILTAALEDREIQRVFDINPAAENIHMSIYNMNLPKYTAGSSELEKIRGSIKALPEKARREATIILSYDYFESVVTQAAEAGLAALITDDTLFNIKYIILDKAAKPVIGDFKYLQINHENMFQDKKKNVFNGIYDFVLSTYMDIHVNNNKAFVVIE